MDMKMLCLYYRDVLGCKPKKRKELLENFCKEHIKDYNEALYFRVIDSALNFAKRKNNRLVEVSKIDIYKSEINYINNLPVEQNFKRILFACLVVTKLRKTMLATIYTTYKRGHYTSKTIRDSDIFKIAHVSSKITKKYYFHILELIGYITTYKNGVMNIKIFDDMPVDTSEVAIQVKNFIHAGYYLDEYNNNPHIIHCKKCGVPFRRKGGWDLYCKEHAKMLPAEPRKYVCIDCGTTYYKTGFASLRCTSCAAKHNKEVRRILSRKNMRKFRERKRAEKDGGYTNKP